MDNQLFGLQPWDPAMLAVATLMIGFAALLASLVPALRAAAVEPMTSLRTE